MRHPIIKLILIATCLRLIFAWSIGLGVDESYMVSAGRVVSLGYFDHPPAAWWLSQGAVRLFGSEAPLIARLPFILLFALTTWLMGRLGAVLGGERAGFFAALTLNLSPVFGMASGTWVLPDGPLDCAAVGAALCLAKGLEDGRAVLRWWCGAGLCAGLALFSKYSAVLTIFGAFIFLLTQPSWFRRPEPWSAAALAALVFSPVLIWNATHDWASFAFQGARAIGPPRFHPFAPVATLAGEALFVLPWFWLPMVVLGFRGFRSGWRDRLLACLAAPPIVVFALISVWSSQRILFHWAAPGYLMLFPLLGRFVAERWDRRAMRTWIVGTALFVLAGLTVAGTQIRFGWLTANSATAEGLDWTSLRDELAARGLLSPGAIVGVANWRDAGKIARALGPDIVVLCLNRDARQFGIAYPAERYAGRDMVLLGAADPSRFDRIEPLPAAAVTLRGEVLKHVAVAIGHGFIPASVDP